MKGYQAIAFFLALVGSVGNTAFGSESPADRVQEIFSKFAETDAMGFDVELQIFPAQDMELPTHFKSMSVRRSGDKLLKVVGPLTVLVTPRATIIVDQRRRTVSFSTKSHREEQLLQFGSGETPFEQMASGRSVSYVGFSPEGERYLIDTPSSSIQQAEIIADPATSRLEKLIYTYSNDLVPGGGRAILGIAGSIRAIFTTVCLARTSSSPDVKDKLRRPAGRRVIA